MVVELDKKDLVSLVMGACPDYSIMNLPIIIQCGYFRGGFHDDWQWRKHDLEQCSDEQLWEIYLLCKQSWEIR